MCVNRLYGLNFRIVKMHYRYLCWTRLSPIEPSTTGPAPPSCHLSGSWDRIACPPRVHAPQQAASAFISFFSYKHFISALPSFMVREGESGPQKQKNKTKQNRCAKTTCFYSGHNSSSSIGSARACPLLSPTPA